MSITNSKLAVTINNDTPPTECCCSASTDYIFSTAEFVLHRENCPDSLATWQRYVFPIWVEVPGTENQMYINPPEAGFYRAKVETEGCCTVYTAPIYYIEIP